jgi:molybdate transport system ATP-binding protein
MRLDVRARKRLTTQFTLDVDFTVPPGVTILFGASGSGKTTLLRCVAGLLRPDAGSLVVGDDVLFDADRGIDVRPSQRRFGFVFQHLALFPHLTAAQNIGYGLSGVTPSERRARVAAIAESLHISAVLNRRPGEISGGQRQRVGLARSVVTDPRVLLLDEPLSALDHDTQSRIIEDLRRWNSAHRIPILYVTHSHREVFALGERVIVLSNGAVVADGAPDEVMNAPETDVMAMLTGFENVLDAVVETRSITAGVMRVRLPPQPPLGARDEDRTSNGRPPESRAGGIADRGVELEVPLTSAQPSAPIRVAIRAGDIIVATEPPRGLSARNVLPGRIMALTPEGSRVTLSVDVGAHLLVHVTPTARETLRLQAGSSVWLVIKTHSCRVVSAREPRLTS